MKTKIIGTMLLVLAITTEPMLADATRKRERVTNPTLRLAEVKAEKYGVPAKLVKAIVCKESSCGENPVPRRETSKSWAKRAHQVTKDRKEFEALMHSYGSTQLSGLYTFLEFGIRPEELTDDETNLEIAALKLSKELAACRGSHYCAAARWNGGPRPNAQARAYARNVIQLEATV